MRHAPQEMQRTLTSALPGCRRKKERAKYRKGKQGEDGGVGGEMEEGQRRLEAVVKGGR